MSAFIPNQVPRLEARAIALRFTSDRLILRLADGREISAPLAWFPRLAGATEAQRANWQWMGDGVGVHWEDVDEDISVPVLLGLPCE
jgi:hypothetical protein